MGLTLHKRARPLTIPLIAAMLTAFERRAETPNALFEGKLAARHPSARISVADTVSDGGCETLQLYYY